MMVLSLSFGFRPILAIGWPQRWVLGRAFLGAGSLGSSFHAFQVSDPIQVMMVQSSLPLIVASIGGQKSSWMATLLLAIGAGIFSVTEFNGFDFRGLMWSCFSVLLAAGAFVALGSATKVPAIVILFWLSLFTTLMGFVLGGRFPLVLNHITDPYLLRIGLLSILVQWTLTQSFQNIGTPLATAFAQMSIFWATGYELLQGDRSDQIMIVVGMGFMILGLFKSYRNLQHIKHADC